MDGRDAQSPEIPDLTETSDVRLANAHLETTIRAMRVRLEQERSAAESAGQAALANMAGEVSALKRNILFQFLNQQAGVWPPVSLQFRAFLSGNARPDGGPA